MKVYPVTPVAKPRQTRSDKWKQRPPVLKYRAFADEVRLRGVKLNEAYSRITFVLPMPQSWSEKKKKLMDGQPHQQVPDLDNLIKALCDAVHKQDCRIWDYHASKIWGRNGEIRIGVLL